MSKPRIKAFMIIDTVQHAQTIKSNIQTWLIGKDIYKQSALDGKVNEQGQVEGYVDIRFNSTQDRNDFRDWIEDQVQNHQVVKTWVLSADVITHLCSHDDTQIFDCKGTQYLKWSKS